MGRKNIICYLALCYLIGGSLMQSCTHDPFEVTPDPMDTTTTPIDTMITNPDTTMTGNPCDSDTVYFETDILPILISNCSQSGCHNPSSAQDGVILTSYQNVINTADVRAFDLDGSDLYEVLVESDPDKKMPPPPEMPLSSSQVNIIARWILQGAQNLSCEEDNTSPCPTDNVSYAQDVLPVLNTYCLGCHSGPAPSGNIRLTNYNEISALAMSGQLYGVIAWEPGYTQMPFGSTQLDDCFIDQLNSWIQNGAPNN